MRKNLQLRLRVFMHKKGKLGYGGFVSFEVPIFGVGHLYSLKVAL